VNSVTKNELLQENQALREKLEELREEIEEVLSPNDDDDESEGE